MAVVQLRIHRRPHPGPPLYGLWLLSAGAWALVGLAVLTQHTALLDHHQLMGGQAMRMAGHDMRMGGLHLPWIVALVFFLVLWQVMTAAMMLPASLPVMTHLVRARRQGLSRAGLGVFLAGYALAWTAFALAWTAFALAAFLLDLLVTGVQAASPWLADRPWVVGAATLAVAGGYEFSACKARWLRACRSPVQMRLVRCDPCAGASWRGGLRHGAHCVGSCGALMGIMFGADLAALPVMVVLTAVMLAEKTLRRGPQLAPVVGSVLLLLAAVAFVHPAGLSLST